MDERSRMVATGCNAEPFLFLNDLCFGPDGALYLTDSGVNIDNFPYGCAQWPDFIFARAVRNIRTDALADGKDRTAWPLTTMVSSRLRCLDRENHGSWDERRSRPAGSNLGPVAHQCSFRLAAASSASMSQNRSHGQIETFPILRDGLPLWDEQKSE